MINRTKSTPSRHDELTRQAIHDLAAAHWPAPNWLRQLTFRYELHPGHGILVKLKSERDRSGMSELIGIWLAESGSFYAFDADVDAHGDLCGIYYFEDITNEIEPKQERRYMTRAFGLNARAVLAMWPHR